MPARIRQLLLPPVDAPPGELAAIQYLRGYAALIVVVQHLLLRWAIFAWDMHLFTLRSGVDIFFVISGFVMVYSTDRGARLGAKEFLARRIVRVVPAYWIVTTPSLLLLLAAPGLAHAFSTSPAHAVASYLFIPWATPDGTMVPVVQLGWTLNYEMFFYALFALGILGGRRRPAAVMGLVLGMLLLLVLAGYLLPLHGTAKFWTQPVILEFALGMVIALLWRGPARVQWPVLVLAVAVAVAMLAWPNWGDRLRLVRFGIPAAVLVAAAVHLRLPRSPFWHRMGDISYSLYLINTLLLAAWGTLWGRWLPHETYVHFAIYALAGLALTIGVAWFFWALVERPLTRAGKRWIEQRFSSAVGPSAALAP
ncbi:MAG: acyltransferase [Sphingomonadales bacterium]|nr:acyltransferase [Sphingomonadales bacterium]MBD3773931.1 acyltransferase [Paracoccaceae bacterium]